MYLEITTLKDEKIKFSSHDLAVSMQLLEVSHLSWKQKTKIQIKEKKIAKKNAAP